MLVYKYISLIIKLFQLSIRLANFRFTDFLGFSITVRQKYSKAM